MAVVIKNIGGPKNIEKILAIPETDSGTGRAECEEIRQTLDDYDIRKEIKSMCYDTTASNTSAEVGACKLLEEFIGQPILYTACRHHTAELVIKKMNDEVVGETSGPTVLLFAKFKRNWGEIQAKIDYSNLVVLDQSILPQWMQQEAREVLIWAENLLKSQTFDLPPVCSFRPPIKTTIPPNSTTQ